MDLDIKHTGYSGRSWNSLGLRMAGAKNLRKTNPLTAVYCTTSFSADKRIEEEEEREREREREEGEELGGA